MRFKAVAATICVLAAVAPSAALASVHAGRHDRGHLVTPSYYLALGDSLALGVQPNADGTVLPTDVGYVNDILAAERAQTQGLWLVDLACPGETTTTMINGGCPDTSVRYSKGNQLAQAVAFIKTHKIALITLDIGADDVDPCVGSTTINVSCVQAGLGAVTANVPQIASALRAAAGSQTPIVAMTYYDPFLADYLDGSQGQVLAAESADMAWELNEDLTGAFTAGGVEVADVADAFDTYAPFSDTTTVPGLGTVPVSVAQICALTWMCTPPPQGPNVHANTSGYATIAQAFENVL